MAVFRSASHFSDNLSSSISPDSNAVTMIFDDLRVSTQSAPLVTRTLPLQLIFDDQNDNYFHHDIRGHVEVGAGTRASLVLYAGGETYIVPLDQYPASTEFEHTFSSTVPARSPYRIVLFLIVEKILPRTEADAFLFVDTLDVSVAGADVIVS